MPYSLHELFLKSNKDSLDDREVEYLLGYVYRIAKIYLAHRYSKNTLLECKIVIIDELAIEVTADLFYTDKKGITKCFQLLNFHKKEIHNETDIHYNLYKIVCSEVDRIVIHEMLKWDLIPIEVPAQQK